MQNSEKAHGSQGIKKLLRGIPASLWISLVVLLAGSSLYIYKSSQVGNQADTFFSTAFWTASLFVASRLSLKLFSRLSESQALQRAFKEHLAAWILPKPLSTIISILGQVAFIMLLAGLIATFLHLFIGPGSAIRVTLLASLASFLTYIVLLIIFWAKLFFKISALKSTLPKNHRRIIPELAFIIVHIRG